MCVCVRVCMYVLAWVIMSDVCVHVRCVSVSSVKVCGFVCLPV